MGPSLTGIRSLAIEMSRATPAVLSAATAPLAVLRSGYCEAANTNSTRLESVRAGKWKAGTQKGSR
jgi:hypothetical protein